MKNCPYYKKCNGCQLQNLDYQKQLQFKQVKAINLLGKFCHVDEIIPMQNPLNYRNKVQTCFVSIKGEMLSGVYQSTTGKVVPVENCMIEDVVAGEIIATLRKLFVSFKVKPYDYESGTGFLRHVLIKRGFQSGQIMVVLVTVDGAIKSQRSFVNALLAKHPHITTVVQNINNNDIKLSLGNENINLYGDGYIEDCLCGLTFRISPKAFYQVNPVQTSALYNKAVEFAELSGDELLIDAYCGTGTIGMLMASKAKKVIGVELNCDAVADAVANAQFNKIDNIEFYCKDAGDFMSAYADEGKNVDVVVTDPPRIGCSREFLQSLVKLSPKKVVYVSCNPQTLQRDLTYLTRKGYKVKKTQPVDMFPYTEHIESVVQLIKKDY